MEYLFLRYDIELIRWWVLMSEIGVGNDLYKLLSR